MKTFEEIREKNVPEDPDIAGRKGRQYAAYHKGLSKSTKIARDASFKKTTKMSDDNPAAYKDRPGDKEARKKPMQKSKHTIKYHQMFGKKGDDK